MNIYKLECHFIYLKHNSKFNSRDYAYFHLVLIDAFTHNIFITVHSEISSMTIIVLNTEHCVIYLTHLVCANDYQNLAKISTAIIIWYNVTVKLCKHGLVQNKYTCYCITQKLLWIMLLCSSDVAMGTGLLTTSSFCQSDIISREYLDLVSFKASSN